MIDVSGFMKWVGWKILKGIGCLAAICLVFLWFCGIFSGVWVEYPLRIWSGEITFTYVSVSLVYLVPASLLVWFAILGFFEYLYGKYKDDIRLREGPISYLILMYQCGSSEPNGKTKGPYTKARADKIAEKWNKDSSVIKFKVFHEELAVDEFLRHKRSL